ncbi:cobyric acid synthase [Aeribacillus alveayuensis]|uniref:Cobyric acid synthase n=1 Tax=Aeribacillus alveayuensis TaxID=279215 RepID=A0ABT9VQ57_9BACI|nr:adenosylcobyric acid synthase [Bacillus alveayuensis]
MKGIMLQGTSSDAGKSFIATAFCALFRQLGYKVAPFKSQNMSNNSYVTIDGKEIGRAQGIQAEAAGVNASVYMNPILLKPRNDRRAEVVLFGESYETYEGREYRERFYEIGLEAIQTSLLKLKEHHDFLVIEGAGSPVEINLNDRELVNMKVAELADVPVILVADIERGGVFANIVGTLQLLSKEERKRVKGIIINKFRGDLSLFENGVEWLEDKTGVKVLGVVPYLPHHMIDSEDSLSIRSRFLQKEEKEIDIAVLRLPYISNYTDVEPFLFEDDVSIRFVEHPNQFGQPDAFIIPGTKSTISDLHWIKELKLDQTIQQYERSGGTIIGICGGYQMLSETLFDEAGSDTGQKGFKVSGLYLLPAVTTFLPKKQTIRSKGVMHHQSGFSGLEVDGYEIHLGTTVVQYDDAVSPLIITENGIDGASYDSGRIIGTYFHHIFENDPFRTQWLNRLRNKKGLPIKEIVQVKQEKADQFDRLANYVKEHLDIDYLMELIESWEKNEDGMVKGNR